MVRIRSLRVLPALCRCALGLLLFALVRPCAAQEAGAALAAVLRDWNEDALKHAPEEATLRGDKRYGDRLDDLSPREANDRLARERAFLDRLGAIGTRGLSPQEQAAAEQLLNRLVEDQRSAPSKLWELPLDPAEGFHKRLEALATAPGFDTAKDYDDYIERLKKVPDQFRQVVSNMMLGLDDGRVQPAAVVETVLAQVNAIVAQKPEFSVFASPLRRFPKTIPQATRQRIADDLLVAIEDDVLPAYARFGRFLTAQVLPAAQASKAAAP